MTYVRTNRSELWAIVSGFPDLLLTGDTAQADGSHFTIETTDDGVTWGGPEAVDVAVERWMTDGAAASTQGHGNREVGLPLRLKADNSVDLAAAEEALARRSGRPMLLKWVPPEGPLDAPAVIFEVWTWHLEHTFDGTDERNLRRTYRLTFTAKPWVRSEDLVQVVGVAPPVTVTTTTIDAATAITGWTGNPNTPAVQSGAVVETAQKSAGFILGQTYVLSLTRTFGAAFTPAQPYLVFDMSSAGGRSSITGVTANGKALHKVASAGTKSWWTLPAGVTSFTNLVFSSSHQVASGAGLVTISLSVADISQTNSLGGVGSTKQQYRTIDVKGAVPTSGSIEVASPTASGLGTVLVYTAPDTGNGYVPAMSRYRTSGNSDTILAEASAVSGQSERLERTSLAGTFSPLTYTVPANQLREATYAVVTRLKCAATGRQPITVSASQAGRQTAGYLNTSVIFADADTWQWVRLGLLELPPSPIPVQSTVPTKLVVAPDFSDATYTPQPIRIDDLWLMDVTHGDWSLVDVGASQRVWFDAPDVELERPRSAVYLGNADDRTDAVAAGYWMVTATGDLDLYPDSTVLFTATDGVAGAVASASYYPRSHTHPRS